MDPCSRGSRDRGSCRPSVERQSHLSRLLALWQQHAHAPAANLPAMGVLFGTRHVRRHPATQYLTPTQKSRTTMVTGPFLFFLSAEFTCRVPPSNLDEPCGLHCHRFRAPHATLRYVFVQILQSLHRDDLHHHDHLRRCVE